MGDVTPAAGKLFRQILPAIALPLFLAVIDQTIVATALPAMATSLRSPEHVSWIVVAYLIAATVAAPVYGNLGDAFGRRRLLLSALVTFLIGSILCALATSLGFLVFGRIVQGLGSGGLITLPQALLGDSLPARERGRYQGNLATVIVVSGALGPIAGGILTEYLGWRSIFLIGIPLTIVAIGLARRLPAVKPPSTSWRLDTAGLLLFACFIVLLLIVLDQARASTLTISSPLIAAFVLAMVAFIALVWREHFAPQPLFPPAVLAQPAIWRTYVLICSQGASQIALVTFLPIYFRVQHGMAAGETGGMLLPVLLGLGLGALATGNLVTRTGLTAIYPTIGMSAAAAVTALAAFALAHLSPLQLSSLLSLSGFFMGGSMNVAMVTLQVAGGNTTLGTTAGIAQLSRSVGAAFGTAAASAVLFLALSLGDYPTNKFFGSMLAQGPMGLGDLSTAQQAMIATSIAGGFQAVFLTIAGFLLCGAVSALALPIRHI